MFSLPPHSWFLFVCRPDATEELHHDSAGNMLLLCQPLHSIVSADNLVTLDPSYFSYHSCQCEQGFVAHLEHDNDALVNMTCIKPEVMRISLWCREGGRESRRGMRESLVETGKMGPSDATAFPKCERSPG